MVGRRKLGRLLLGGILAGGGVAGTVAYARADSIERRKIKVGLKGVIRFIRSISVGLLISLDYYWAGRGLDEASTHMTPGLVLAVSLSDLCGISRRVKNMIEQ